MKLAQGQLPKGMEHCTILFKECEKGHGWLTAKNWTDFPCPTCRIQELEETNDRLHNAIVTYPWWKKFL